MSPTLPANTSVSLQPRKVEYRTPSGFGIRCVTIEIIGSDPRITAWSEHYSQREQVIPLMLYFSEIQLYVSDARARLKC